jgi:hypothetical protein
VDRQLSVGKVEVSPQPEFVLGQYVRILRGEHRGTCGSIIACERDNASDTWVYFVKASRVEYGPYTAKELR